MRVFRYAMGLVFALALVLNSCSAPEKKVDVMSIRKAIEAQDQKFAEAFNRGNVAGVLAFYTENALILPPNSEMIRGRKNIEKLIAVQLQMGFKDLSLTTTSVESDGNMAYEIGKYSGTLRPEGREAMMVSGKYVVIWKRQHDG